MRILIALTIGLLASASCLASNPMAGRWEGTAQVPDLPLRVVVDLDQDTAGIWTGSVIIPGLSVNGVPLADINVHGDDVSFTIKGALADPKSGPAKFQARLEAGRTLTGSLVQAGNTAAISLKRSGSAQVDAPILSTPVGKEFEGKWVGDYELMGYSRHVTLTLTNRGNAAAGAEFIIVGKKVNNLPVDLITQDGAFVRIESHEIGINFEGRYRKDTDAIDGTYEQGPFELPLVLHRETGK